MKDKRFKIKQMYDLSLSLSIDILCHIISHLNMSINKLLLYVKHCNLYYGNVFEQIYHKDGSNLV